MAVEIHIDVGQIQGFVDASYTIGKAITETNFLNNVSNKLAEASRHTFNTHIDAIAQASPESMHHVYEWDAVGSPAARLFHLGISSGTAGSATLDLSFLPSRKILPERRLVGQTIPVIVRRKDGTTYTKEMEVWPRQHDHVFTWKSTVMEAGVTVNIQAKNSNMLFWIDPDRDVGYMTAAMSLDYSRQKTAGQFTMAWNIFWRQIVRELVLQPKMQELEPHLERDASAEIVRMAKKNAFKPAPAKNIPGEGFSVRFTNNGKPFAGRFVPRENKKAKGLIQRNLLRRL